MDIIYKTDQLCITLIGEKIQIDVKGHCTEISAHMAEQLASAIMRRLHETQVLLLQIYNQEAELEWARIVSNAHMEPPKLDRDTFTGTHQNDVTYERIRAKIDIISSRKIGRKVG